MCGRGVRCTPLCCLVFAALYVQLCKTTYTLPVVEIAVCGGFGVIAKGDLGSCIVVGQSRIAFVDVVRIKILVGNDNVGLGAESVVGAVEYSIVNGLCKVYGTQFFFEQLACDSGFRESDDNTAETEVLADCNKPPNDGT